MRWSALIPGVVFFLLLVHHAFVSSQAPEPGYLDFDNLPETNFSCQGKVIGGYYADVETGCQMFHVCTIGQKGEVSDIKFLCLNGTVFDQETRVCERLDEVDCSKTEAFYDLNLELYGNNPAVGSHSDDDSDDEDEPSKDEREEASTESNEEPATPSVAPSFAPVSSAATPPPTTTGSLPITTTTTPGPPASPSNFPNALNALLALHNALHQNGHQGTTVSPRPSPQPSSHPGSHPGSHQPVVPHNILLSQLSSGHHFPAVESHRQKQQQELQEQLVREQLQFQKHHQQLQQHQLHQQKQQQQQQVMQQRQQQQQQRQQQQQQHQQQQDLLKETQQKVRGGSSTLSPPQSHSHVSHLTSHHVQSLPRPSLGYSHHLPVPVPSTSRPPLVFSPVVPPRPKPAAIPFRPFHPASSTPGSVASSTTPVPDPSSYLLHQVRVPSSSATSAAHPPRSSSSYFLVRDDDDQESDKAFSTTINHPTSKPGGGATGPPARSSFSFKPLTFSTPPPALQPQAAVAVNSHVSSVTRSVTSSSSTSATNASTAPKKVPFVPGNKSAQELVSLPKEQEFISRFNPDDPVSPPMTSVGETGPDADAEEDTYEYEDEGGVEEDDDTYFGDVSRVVDKPPRREKRDLGTLADVESVPGVAVIPRLTHLPQRQANRRRVSKMRKEETVPVQVQQKRPTPRGPGRGSREELSSRPVPVDKEEPVPLDGPTRRRPNHPEARTRSRGGQRYSFMEDPLLARKAAALAEAAEPSTTTTPAPLPNTGFSCSDKVAGGFYADTEADCQLFHICSQAGTDGRLTDNKFLCGPGTRFNQRSRTCQARDLVDCKLSSRYYNLNAHFKIPPPEEEIPVPTFDSHRVSRKKRALSKKKLDSEDEDAFECKSAGLFADIASGCERFHLCESAGSSPLSSFRCPGDQLFNQRLGACDAADLVDCALLSRPEHEFRRQRGHSRRRRSTPILVSVNTQPKDSVQFYYADFEDAVPVDVRRPQRQPSSTEAPLYDDYEYEDDVATTSPPSASPPPMKSVSYYVYAAKDDTQTVTATRPPNSAVPEDYVDDNYEAQSQPQTPTPPNPKLAPAVQSLMDLVDDYPDDFTNGLTPTTKSDAAALSTTSPIPQSSTSDKPVATRVLEEYDYVANDYDDSTKDDVSPKDKSDSSRPFSQIDNPNINETLDPLELTTTTTSTTPSTTTTSTTPSTTTTSTTPSTTTTTTTSTTTASTSVATTLLTTSKPYRARRPPNRRRPPPPRKTQYRSQPEKDSFEVLSTEPPLTSSPPPLLSSQASSVQSPETTEPLPSAPPLPSPTTPSTTSTEAFTTNSEETMTSSTEPTVAVGPFVCTGREMNKFHRDHNNCRMFHYCTAGFTARQVLDFRFECVDGTSYDEAENRCQVPESGSCAR